MTAAADVLEAEEPRDQPDPTTDIRVTKKLSVTFSNGLPVGTCGRFKYDGQIWIAYPAKKNAQILAVMDRFLGIYAGLTKKTASLVGRYPDNAGVSELAVIVFEAMNRRDMALDKIKAVTS